MGCSGLDTETPRGGQCRRESFRGATRITVRALALCILPRADDIGSQDTVIEDRRYLRESKDIFQDPEKRYPQFESLKGLAVGGRQWIPGSSVIPI